MTKTDEKPYTFSSKRTQCPECGSSDGRADIIHDARTDTSYNLDSGYFKCHSCDTIKTPNIHEKDWRINDAPKISKVSNKPKNVELPLNERKRILSDNYDESIQSTASGFHVYLQALKSQIRDITVLETFEIGTDKANATNFWYRDINGDLSFAKTMAYSNECKRLKEDNNPLKNADGTSKTALNGYTKGKSSKGLIYEYHISDLGYNTNGIFNYNRLQQGDYDKIIILESEKNCVFATILFPQYCFVTGGGSNAMSDGKFEIVSKFSKIYNKTVSVLYDLDKAGYENSDKLADKHNITNSTHLFKDYIDGIKSIDAPSGFDVADYCSLIFTNKLKSHKKKDLIFELEKIENPELGKTDDKQLIKFDKTERFLKDNYKFRFNLIKTKYEFSKDGKNWNWVEDPIVRSIVNDVKRRGRIPAEKDMVKDLIFSSEIAQYDVFMEWINSMSDYNPNTEPNYIQQIISKVKAQDDVIEYQTEDVLGNIETKQIYAQDIWADYFTRWFVGVYAQASQQTTAQFMLILIGKGGIGKSQFVRRMLPSQFKEYITSFQFGELDDSTAGKDRQLQLCNNIILDCDELEGMSKAKQNAVKSTIASNGWQIRLPYGSAPQWCRRYASLIGSSNINTILADETGSRRYMMVNVESIDFKSIDDELISRAYKQAQYLFDVLGFEIHFSQKEIQFIDSYNEDFRNITLAEQLIRDNFRPTDDHTQGLTASELFVRLTNLHSQVREYSMFKISAILDKLGYTKKRTRDGKTVKQCYNIAEILKVSQYYQ